jgi:hypothetical protein
MKRYCCTCKWHDIDFGTCCNADSEFRASLRHLDDTCEFWSCDSPRHCMNCVCEHVCDWEPAGDDDYCEDWRADLETEAKA